MPKNSQNRRRVLKSFPFEHCILLIEEDCTGLQFDLSGDLDKVSLVDREKVAFHLAKELGYSHEEAYEACWALPAKDGE